LTPCSSTCLSLIRLRTKNPAEAGLVARSGACDPPGCLNNGLGKRKFRPPSIRFVSGQFSASEGYRSCTSPSSCRVSPPTRVPPDQGA
jgi:hypothetical protein